MQCFYMTEAMPEITLTFKNQRPTPPENSEISKSMHTAIQI